MVLTDKGSNNEDTGRDTMFPRVSCRACGPAASGRPRTEAALPADSRHAPEGQPQALHTRLRRIGRSPGVLELRVTRTFCTKHQWAQEPAASNMAVAFRGRIETALVC